MISAAPNRSPSAPFIARLYDDAQIAPPTADRPSAPLRRLILSQELNHRELPLLSSRAAMNFLIARGAVLESWAGADAEDLAGFLYANAGGGSIFVRQEDAVARRRFSAAHELAHYLLHFPLVQK